MNTEMNQIEPESKTPASAAKEWRAKNRERHNKYQREYAKGCREAKRKEKEHASLASVLGEIDAIKSRLARIEETRVIEAPQPVAQPTPQPQKTGFIITSFKKN